MYQLKCTLFYKKSIYKKYTSKKILELIFSSHFEIILLDTRCFFKRNLAKALVPKGF